IHTRDEAGFARSTCRLPGFFNYPIKAQSNFRASTTSNKSITPATNSLNRCWCIATDEQFWPSLLHRWWTHRPYAVTYRFTRPDALHKGKPLFKALAPTTELGRGSTKVILSCTNA